MKNLKTFLGAFLVVVMLSSLAVAGWNIQQGDRGETRWVNEDGLTVGAGGGSAVSVKFTNMADAWTMFIPIVRPGIVTRMHATMDAAHPPNAASSAISVSQMWSDANGSIWTPINGLSVTMTGVQFRNPGGQISDVTGTASAPDRNNESYFVTHERGVLAVRNDGGGTGVFEGTVTIVIE